MPGDQTRMLLTLLIAAWVFAFVFSFISYANGGESAVMTFLGWQGICGLLAIAVFGVSRAWPKSTPVRQLSLVPLVLAIVVAVLIFSIHQWAQA